MTFDDAANGYERLRKAITTIYREGRTSEVLIGRATEYHQSRVTAGAIAELPSMPHHTAVTKFRTGQSKRLRIEAARPLWDYLINTRPQLLGVEEHSEAGFLGGLFWYFDVDRRKHATLTGQARDCTFLVYHFTEMLADSMPDAVVRGELQLKQLDSGLLQVTERQAYDGRLGRSASRETNIGYCFPKFQSVCMLLKDSGSAPKLYDFHRCGLGEADKLSWMKGRLARISPGAPLFYSNAYAVRVDPAHREELNIFAASAIPKEIMAELKNG